MRRAALPGTKHSRSLDRDEQRILSAIQMMPELVKLETLGICWTGSSRRLLCLTTARFVGSTGRIVEAHLHLGPAKRRILLFLATGVTLTGLTQRLHAHLTRYRVLVSTTKPLTLS